MGHTGQKIALPSRRVAASNGQAEFRLFSPFRLERRHGNTQEPNASHDRKERFEQGVAELFELASRPDRHLTGAAARDHLKVGELDLERDGAAANAGALAVVPYLVCPSVKIPKYQYVGFGFSLSARCGKRRIGDWIGGSNGCTSSSDRIAE